MTDSPKPTSQYLLQHSKDGTWPYLYGRKTSTEATAWCSIACRNESSVAAKSLEYLLSIQNKDGGWSTEAGAEPSDWSTGMALVAVQVLSKALAEDQSAAALIGRAATSINKAAAYLLNTRTELVNDFAKILMYIGDLDYPRGWGWTPNTFEWVEPSSHAVLAIKMSPVAADRPFQRAVEEAQKYYMEKYCEAKGWNYGVAVSVGKKLPVQPVPTAWALLAMQGEKNPKIADAVAYLRDTDDVTTQTLQARALSIMALAAHGVDIKDRVKALNEQFSTDNAFASNFMIAGMCTIASALPADGNPLLSKSSG